MTTDTVFVPTEEQADAIAAFAAGDSLMLNACAGSGKTATLEAMARADTRRGLYIVFNNAAATEARQRFPELVDVRTSHSLAVGHVRQLGYPEGRLFTQLNANAIASVLNLGSLDVAGGRLQPFELGQAVRRTLTNFCHSDSEAVLTTHVARPGRFAAQVDERIHTYLTFVREQTERLWDRMRRLGENEVPLGHDGYFKLWSLDCPTLPYDYVLLDEAQDSNPAMIHVLRHQRRCQQVYVGDRYQQIYAWRGAVNAMEQLDAIQCALTHSFRYGQRIADFATRLLEPLGNDRPLSGRRDLESTFASRSPDACLSRTNAALIQILVDCQDTVDQVHIVGGGQEVLRLLDDVRNLKSGRSASFGELFGFSNWHAVVDFNAKVGTNSLSTLVQLVEGFGEPMLRKLISTTCADASRASMVLSTAHRAKGLEYDEVSLAPDFPAPLERTEFVDIYGDEALVDAAEFTGPEGSVYLARSEVQLLYVAATRARRHVTLPPWCYTLFSDLVGDAPCARRTAIEVAVQHARKTDLIGAHGVSELSTDYAILDFETTGLAPDRGDRVIEIGVSRLSNGREIDHFSTLVHPGMPIPAYITDLTGISNRMVRKAPSAKRAFTEAMAFVGDATLVAHNASFDRKFLRHELRVALGIEDDREVLCTLRLSRRVFQSFGSHKLGDVAKELRIKTRGSHRALADARTTARVLAIMIERLREAYPLERIDSRFLSAYMKKPKAELPDLSTKRLCRAAAKRAAPSIVPAQSSPAKPPVPPPAARETVIASRATPRRMEQSDAADRAAMMHQSAVEALEELEQLLEHTLDIDDRLDWSSLAASRPFCSTLKKRSWMTYDLDGRPVDVVYLTLDQPRPVEPLSEAASAELGPRVQWWDYILFRVTDKRRRASQIQANAANARERFDDELSRWEATADRIDRTNKERDLQFIDDLHHWEQERQAHTEHERQQQQDVEASRNAYEQRLPAAIEEYAAAVLARSRYPDRFPREVAVRYHESSRVIEADVKLAHPDDMPTTAAFKYVKSLDEIKMKPLSQSRRNALYVNVVKAVCVRTLHELFESDTANALNGVVVNGYVATVDPATGRDICVVIASVATSKTTFSALRLDRVRVAECFDGLNGRGSSRGLPKLAAVTPFAFEEVPTGRDVEAGSIA